MSFFKYQNIFIALLALSVAMSSCKKDGNPNNLPDVSPDDYAENDSALFHPLTRRLMQLIDFRHGGADFDRRLSRDLRSGEGWLAH